MAQKDPQIKQLIEGLQKTIRTVGNTSKEQIQINRELLKVITLLDSGLARNEEDARDLISRVKKGLELTDETAAEWAKSRKIAKKDLDSIFLKFREIERIYVKINDKATDFKEEIESASDALDLQIDLSAKLFDSYKEINQAIAQSRKAVEKFGVGATEANRAMSQIINTTLAKRNVLGTVFDDMFSSLENANDLILQLQTDSQTMINNLSGVSVDVPVNFDPKSGKLDMEVSKIKEMIELENKARLAGLVDFFDKNTELQQNLARKIAASMPGSDIEFDIDTGSIKKAGIGLEQGSEAFISAISKLDQIAIDQNALSTVSEMYMDIFELISKGTMRTADENKLLDQLNSKLDLGTQLLVRANIERQRDLDTLTSSIELEKSRLKLVAKYGTHLQFAENAVLKVGAGFDYINAILPAGIGDLLGLQKISFTLIDAHRKGVKSFFDEIGKGSTKAEALSSYMKSFAPSLKLALTPTTLLIAGVALVFKFVSDITAKYKDMAQNMKISLLQAKQFHEVQLDILTSQKNQFSTMEDIQAVQTAMIGSSGRIGSALDDANAKLILGLSEVGKVFGYGAEQAVNLQKIFENIGANDQLALNLQQSLGLAAELAGLSPQLIAQDAIDASEEIYTYFSGMPDQAAKAIIQVRRMGMSLKQAGQIAQKMLDLEGFMTDMYELQAMTGPGGIDFSRAFDRGLMGDVEGMTREIMDQIGTTAELNQMDYLTRTKIAKTLGMSMEDLSKSVMLREKMNQLGPEEAKMLDANLDRMGDISKMTQSQIQDRLKQLQSTDRLAVAWDKIKGIFVKSLLPLVEVFANVIEAISPVLDLIIIPLKIIGSLIKNIIPLVNILLIPFKLIGKALDWTLDKFDDFGSSASDAESSMSKIVNPIANIDTGLGSVSAHLSSVGGLVKSIGSAMAAWYIGKKLIPGMGSFKDLLGSTIKKIPVVGSLFGKVFSTMEEKSTDAATKTQKSLDRLQVDNLDVVKVNVPPVELAPVPIEVKPPSELKPLEQKVIVPPIDPPKPLYQDVIQRVKAPKIIPFKPIEQDVIQNIRKNPNTISLKPITQEVIQKPVEHPAIAVKKKTKTTSVDAVDVQKSKIAEEPISGSKKIFKSLQSVASKTLAAIAFDSARALLPLGESGNEALDSVAKHAPLILGGLDIFGGLFENLEYGIRKVFEKGIEEKISPMLDPITKKTRKAFEKIGDRVPGKGLLSKWFGKQPEIDIAPLEQSEEIVQRTVETIQPTKKIETGPTSAERPPVVAPKTDTKSVPEIRKIDVNPPMEKVSKFEKFKDIVSNIFTGLSDVIKTVWKSIKSSLTEIVKFVVDTVKQLSGGIGTAIQNVLGGIAKGLNQFKTSAIKGAATLVILSGALWISSKAIQNFASVKWEDIAKAGVTLAGLTAAALVLGATSPDILLGAAALAMLGTALIPTAMALQMFSDIKWEDLGKAGVAIVGLTAGILGLGAIMMSGVGAAAILSGSIALGIMSAALAGFGGALMIAGKGLSIIGPQLESIVGQIRGFSGISYQDLFGIASGITAIGMSLLSFAAMNLGSSIVNSIAGLFGSEPIKRLESLAKLADPLEIVAGVIATLSTSLLQFSGNLSNLSLENLDALREVTKLDVGKLEPLQRQLEVQTQSIPDSEFAAVTPDLQLSPDQQRRTIRPLPPTRESTAQDIKIRPIQSFADESMQDSSTVQPMNAEFNQSGNKNVERLLRELIAVMTQYAQRPNVLQFGKSEASQMHSILKPYSNNIG